MTRRVYLGYVGWKLYAIYGWPLVETAFAGGQGLVGFRGIVLDAVRWAERIEVFAECEG